ncbi:Activator of Hsp90 ATPase-like proteinue 1/2-like C-terminal domain-containing protein [Entamoeba marina]
MSEIQITSHFMVPPRVIYQTLNDPQRLTALMQAPAQYKAVVGENFVLYGGAVSGKIVELVPNEKIVYKWRFNSWPEGKYSDVVIKLEEGEEADDECDLRLNQTGVETHDRKRTEQGWNEIYFERMKKMFGY